MIFRLLNKKLTKTARSSSRKLVSKKLKSTLSENLSLIGALINLKNSLSIVI